MDSYQFVSRKKLVEYLSLECSTQKHPLSYSMSKTIGASRYVLSDAYLGWIKFEVEPREIQTIKTGIEKIREILRFLLIKAPRETTFTFAKVKATAEAKEESVSTPATEVMVE